MYHYFLKFTIKLKNPITYIPYITLKKSFF